MVSNETYLTFIPVPFPPINNNGYKVTNVGEDILGQ